jgi:poly(A) polymerase
MCRNQDHAGKGPSVLPGGPLTEVHALLIRYRRSEDGRPVAKAVVYTQNEHRIDRGRVDPDALRIVERLRENGHEAYIVGGAVRDLLLGRKPKDFDIVTDAQPPRIKRVFHNSRVIGKRFRLVHVYAGPKIFEVSTFRSIANGTVGNEFGTMDEDAFRRDFTLNALYYDPIECVLVDYVGGFKDVAARKVKPVIPLATIFREDPVRMIRCVKYACTTGFRIPFQTRRAISRDAGLLAGASPSRLTEEFVKILGSGHAADIVEALAHYRLLIHIQPEAAGLLERNVAYRSALAAELAELDEYSRAPNREKRLSTLLAAFLKPYLVLQEGLIVDTPEAYQDALREARSFLAPLNLPRVELEAAVLFVFKKLGISPSQKPRRPLPERQEGQGDAASKPRRRRRRGGSAHGEEKAGPGGPGPSAQAPASHAQPRPGMAAEAARSPSSAPKKQDGEPSRARPKPNAGGSGNEAAPPSGGQAGAASASKKRRRRRKKSSGQGGAPQQPE